MITTRLLVFPLEFSAILFTCYFHRKLYPNQILPHHLVLTLNRCVKLPRHRYKGTLLLRIVGLALTCGDTPEQLWLWYKGPHTPSESASVCEKAYRWSWQWFSRHITGPDPDRQAPWHILRRTSEPASWDLGCFRRRPGWVAESLARTAPYGTVNLLYSSKRNHHAPYCPDGLTKARKEL